MAQNLSAAELAYQQEQLARLQALLKAVDEERIVPWEFGSFLPPATDLESGVRAATYGGGALLGLLLNLVTVGVIVKGKLYKNWTYAMLINLCLADILICAVYIIFYLPSVVMQKFEFPMAICTIRQMLIFTPMLVSVLTFLLTALQRYFAIAYNKTGLALFSMRWLPLVLVVVWVSAVAISVPAGYPGPYYANVWIDFCAVFSDELLTTMKSINCTVILVPVVVVLLLYCHMYWVVRKAAMKIRNKGGGGGGGGSGGAAGGGAQKPVSSHHKHMARVLFILYLTATVSFLPYILFFFIISSLGGSGKSAFYMVMYLMRILSCCASPVVYGFMFKPVKKEYQRIFCCRANNEVTMVTEMPTSNTC